MRDILNNVDLSKCPNNYFCPVGVKFDQHGRLFMSSDFSGEIYVLTRANVKAAGLLSTPIAVPTPVLNSCTPGVHGISPLCVSSPPNSKPTVSGRHRRLVV